MFDTGIMVNKKRRLALTEWGKASMDSSCSDDASCRTSYTPLRVTRVHPQNVNR